MEAFTTLVSTAASLETVNVDTDQIIPGRFLNTPRSEGYGQFLFRDLRFGEDGTERPGFVLNRPEYRDARILVGNSNFGCGSSREGAVYALLDYGFRCVIAPSFGDVFFNNALRNGLLPVRIDGTQVASLRRIAFDAPCTSFTVDLVNQVVSTPQTVPMHFAIDPLSKACLLQGMDDLAFTAQHRAEIDAFVQNYRAQHPWLVPADRSAP